MSRSQKRRQAESKPQTSTISAAQSPSAVDPASLTPVATKSESLDSSQAKSWWDHVSLKAAWISALAILSAALVSAVAAPDGPKPDGPGRLSVDEFSELLVELRDSQGQPLVGHGQSQKDNSDNLLLAAQVHYWAREVEFLTPLQKIVKAKYDNGIRGGDEWQLALVDYSLLNAQANLALVKGERNEAIALSQSAEKAAQRHLDSLQAHYEADKVTLDMVVAANRLRNTAALSVKQIELSQTMANQRNTP